MLLERMEILPAAPATVPPPIFAASDLYFAVSLSASALLRKRVEGYFIVGFRSRRRLRGEGGLEVVHGAPSGPHGAAKVSGRAMGPILGSVRLPSRLQFSRSSIFQKTDVVKNLGLFDFAKVPQSEKYENRHILPDRLDYQK